MTIFIDTANVEQIKKYISWGIVSGVTTNQKIFQKEGKVDFKQRIKQICKVSLGYPVSIELTGTKSTDIGLLMEAKTYRDIDKSIVIKVPMWGDGRGLVVAKGLINNGIKVNMTCCMSFNQAILACELGVTYVSLFYRRINDWNEKYKTEDSGEEVIEKTRKFIDQQGFSTEIIAGSIRQPVDVVRCFDSGAHIVTITPKVLEKMPFHDKTEETIKEFDKAWEEFRR